MLSTVEINTNKQKVISIIRDKLSSRFYDEQTMEDFIAFLDNLGYFTAPATATHQYSYEGGLCEYSMKTTNLLVLFNNLMSSQYNISKYEYESLLIIGLFHQLYKSNLYTKYIANTKQYSENGSKKDNMGNYEWVSSENFKFNNDEDRVISGDFETANYIMLSRYMLLTEEEIIALINYSNGLESNRNSTSDLYAVFNKYTLVDYLHTASLWANYVLNNVTEEPTDLDEEDDKDLDYE